MKIKYSAAALLFALSACSAPSATAPVPEVSPTISDCASFVSTDLSGDLPALEVECLQGEQTLNLAGLKGPMLIPIWASWCVPCSEEMPVMQLFSELYGDYVPVLGLAILDESNQAIAGSVNWGVTLPSLEDPDGLLRPELGVTAPPTTLFIDESGAIVHKEFGAISGMSELKVLVEQYLGVKV